MRQVVLDTETTGLEPEQGHRIIEIGCIELVNRRVTGEQYQTYLNPQRDIDAGAVEVHGLTTDFLGDMPLFEHVVDEFLSFVRGAELVIHNAPFDVGFLDRELALAGSGYDRIGDLCSVVDTLELARQLHPGQRNNLDALCRRYEIDNSHRTQHGALLDAGILADVYLAMTGGQASLWSDDGTTTDEDTLAPIVVTSAGRSRVRIEPTADDIAAHEAMLDRIGDVAADGCVWRRTKSAAG